MMTNSKSNVTLSDLAKALGTSPSTVSRALKDHPKISKATKEMVKEMALSMGYVNSVQATIQQNFNNKTIGIIVPSLTLTKYSILIESARQIIEKEGYSMIVACSSESKEQEKNNLQLFESLNLQGIIASLTYEDKNPEYLSKLIKQKPVVLFDRISFELTCNKVMIDHFQVGFRAVQHLLNIGCKRIAHLGGNINCPLTKQIATGYKTGLRNGGIKLESKFEVFSDYLLDDMIKATEIIYSQIEKPDAILVDDILAAQKLISILQTRKINIPEDVAIIAIGDEKDYSYYSPSITTIQLPYSKVGKKAATILFDQINNKNRTLNSEITVEPFHLNIRNSTLRN